MKIYCQSGKLAVEIEAGCVFLNRCPGMIYYPAEARMREGLIMVDVWVVGIIFAAAILAAIMTAGGGQ